MIQLFQKFKLFQGLGPSDLEAIVQAAHRRRVQKGSPFFHQGDTATVFYVLTEGQVRLTQLNAEGHNVLIGFVGPGGGFGIVAALANMVYPLSVQAVEDCQALGWDSQTLVHLMERHPHLTLNALQLVAERFQELQHRYQELATERVERRVARALLRLTRHSGRRVPQGVLIGVPLSRQDLAEMTGTTLFTVSRILRRWVEQGLVEAGRERVVILLPHGLVTIAEDLPPTAPPKESP